MEKWENIAGYEGLYQVSNQGRVKYLGGGRAKVMRILKGSVNRDGYTRVTLWKDMKATYKWIHRLVAETFIPNTDNKPCVEHIIPVSVGGTNSVDNLRWATYRENNNNPITKELQKENRFKMPVSKYSLDGSLICEYESARDAEKDGFDHTKILRVCRGEKRYKTHKGFVWRFKDENNVV